MVMGDLLDLGDSHAHVNHADVRDHLESIFAVQDDRVDETL